MKIRTWMALTGGKIKRVLNKLKFPVWYFAIMTGVCLFLSVAPIIGLMDWIWLGFAWPALGALIWFIKSQNK